jgi:cyclopropane-fatty-acyl-phospholipid synthase
MDTTQAHAVVQSVDGQSSGKLRLIERLFARMLRGLKDGSLRINFPGGASVVVGDCSHSLLELSIVDSRFFKKVMAGGSIGFGEAYVDGLWTAPDLTALLSLLAKNQKDIGRLRKGFSLLTQKLNALYHRARRNTVEKSKENIQEHYDLSNAFYETFLDPTMTYSSAYFKSSEETLEEAQWNKIDRMLDLAGVKAGDHILEIGSGWGALAQRAAERGCTVKTITLSEEQYAYAKDRFLKAGLTDQIEIELRDYRHLHGQFDAVLSCEMIEAVGREYLESYFQVVRDSLKPGAKAVLQSITIPDERYEAYSRGCDWIQKHIFPGGHLPSPGALKANVCKTGQMQIQRMDSFGHDYAETLKRWAHAFNSAQARVNELGFDAKFCRKWNYYLSYCEAGFMNDLIDVQHVVIERGVVSSEK